MKDNIYNFYRPQFFPFHYEDLINFKLQRTDVVNGKSFERVSRTLSIKCF